MLSTVAPLVLALLGAGPGNGTPVDFTRQVLPLLERRCAKCHGAQEAKNGLRLHTADALRKGGITDDLIVAGHSERSLIVRRVLGQGGEDPMPPKGDPVPPAELALLRAWIDQGAAMPTEEATFQPGTAGLRRLTDQQYRSAVSDLFGVTLDDAMHATGSADTFANVRAYGTTTAEWSVELYRDTALLIARRVFADADRRRTVVGCEPRRPDDLCARSYLARAGRRLWRRPLTAPEALVYVRLARRIARARGSAWTGVEAATAALLQSPYFLYAAETGVTDPATPARVRLGGYELATRMALFLWNGIPDDDLLDVAGRGGLDEVEGVRARARAMLSSPRAREGVNAFFAELLDLTELHRLAKDPVLYPGNTPALRQAMGLEVRRLLERVVFEERGDLLEIYETRNTFANAELARIYGLSGAFGDELVPVTLPEEAGRTGLLGTAAFLATNALATRSSPTLRGVFVRERLLCQEVPPPPDDVTTELRRRAAEHGPQTMRQRLAQHASDGKCASCHRFFDPIGLALETFDALGARRQLDDGLPVDVAGQLDGVAFEGLPGIARALRLHPRADACLVEQLYRYATGHAIARGERKLIEGLVAAFRGARRDLLSLLVEIVASDGFRYVTLAPMDDRRVAGQGR